MQENVSTPRLVSRSHKHLLAIRLNAGSEVASLPVISVNIMPMTDPSTCHPLISVSRVTSENTPIIDLAILSRSDTSVKAERSASIKYAGSSDRSHLFFSRPRNSLKYSALYSPVWLSFSRIWSSSRRFFCPRFFVFNQVIFLTFTSFYIPCMIYLNYRRILIIYLVLWKEITWSAFSRLIFFPQPGKTIS